VSETGIMTGSDFLMDDYRKWLVSWYMGWLDVLARHATSHLPTASMSHIYSIRNNRRQLWMWVHLCGLVMCRGLFPVGKATWA
jgi:hypothetical protein